MTKRVLLNFACLALACCLLCPTVWATQAADEVAAATRSMIEELGLNVAKTA